MAKRTNRQARGLVAVIMAMSVHLIMAVGSSAAQCPGTTSTTLETPDRFARTPLMLAAVKGDVDQVRSLLAQGADINAKDKNGMTALMWAAPSVSLLLLQNGADTQLRDRYG